MKELGNSRKAKVLWKITQKLSTNNFHAKIKTKKKVNQKYLNDKLKSELDLNVGCIPIEGGACCNLVAGDPISCLFGPLIPCALGFDVGGGKNPWPTVGFNGVTCGESVVGCIECTDDCIDNPVEGRVKLAEPCCDNFPDE